MNLTEEQKLRILDEERQRIAEQQYREQIRRELLSESLRPAQSPNPSVQTPRDSKPNGPKNVFAIASMVVGLCALVLFIGYLQHSRDSARSIATQTPSKVEASQISPFHKKEPSALIAPVKLTTAEIAERATPSVAVIENINENGEKAGHGSGYLYSDDGIIVTNYHVVRGAAALNIRLRSGASYRADTLLGYDVSHDVAVVRTTGLVASPLPTEIGELVKVGEKVVAIGAPLGLESTVSEGIISALRNVAGTQTIQTTASISPGSSGGPLLNEFGRVIGLTTSHLRDGQNLNLVVSARHIAELLDRKRPISLSEMLEETKTTVQVAGNTFVVPARAGWRVPIAVPMQSGAELTGSYEISGGSGNDVEVVLLNSENRIVLNSGRVNGSGHINLRLSRGNYVLVFGNQFSTFTSKSVSPDLKLTYYR